MTSLALAPKASGTPFENGRADDPRIAPEGPRSIRQHSRRRSPIWMGGCVAVVLFASPCLASVPADAPVADVVVTHTAVLETPGHQFVARGRGVWLSEATALARARELDGYRARMALLSPDVLPPWVPALLGAVDLVLKVAALIATAWACERVLCR